MGMSVRDRLLYLGADSLTTAELISLIIQPGMKTDAVAVAEKIVEYIPSLPNATTQELTSIDGVSLNKATTLLATIELAKRLNQTDKTAKRFIRCSQDVADILMPKMMHLDKEHVVALLLNTKGAVISQEIISIGTLDSSFVNMRELYNPAIKRNAAAMIIAHNHPSGDSTPSSEDYEVTKRAIEAGRILGIKLLDHIVIGKNCYTSIANESTIEF